MGKRGYMKTVAFALAMVFISGTALTGCGGKKQVDYGLEGESEQADTGAMLVSRLNVPESYKGDITGISSDTGLSAVRIDAAQISVPEKDKMSVVYCQKNVIDSEYKKRICENFLDVNEGVYVYDPEKPYKGDLEKTIEDFQEYADSETDETLKAEYGETIKELRDELKTASDEREGAGDYTADDYVGYKEGHMWQVSFGSDEQYDTGFNISLFGDYLDYRPMENATFVNCYSSEYNNGRTLPDNSAKISKDDAIRKGLEFLASCGINDVVQTDCYDNMWEYSNQDMGNIGFDLDGYVIKYKKGVDGVPVYTPVIYNLDALNSSSGDLENVDDSVTYEQADEVYRLTVDDNGILSADAVDISRPTGEKDDNVKLMTWDEVLKVLPDAVNTFYSENKTNYSEITFNDVRLTYYKVKDGDGYKYVPVWAFTECSLDQDGGNSDILPPVQLIMINAVDGSLIDLKSALLRY